MSRGQRITALVAAIAFVFAGAAGALFLANSGNGPSVSRAQAQGYEENRGVSVQGEGQISVVPDVARIVLGVEVEGTDLDALREDANARMNDVIEALMGMGFKEADIQTLRYDVRVQDPPDRPMDERSEMIEEEMAETDEPEAEPSDEGGDDGDDAEDMHQPTYVLTQLVQVRISDVDSTGDVIDTALDAGANQVSSISFEVSDNQEAVEQARELAVEEARNKAEHLAELTGVSLGAPLRIEENSPSGPSVRMEEFAMDDAAEADGMAAARIAPGEQTISVHVYITYAIQ